MNQPVVCPVCKSEGRTSFARRISFDLEKREAIFQCMDYPKHEFPISLDKEKK